MPSPLTPADVLAVINMDAIKNNDTSGDAAAAAIHVITTRLGHVFASAGLGADAAASAEKSAKSVFADAITHAKERWTSISGVPAGLTLDLTADMTWDQYLKAPVPNVTISDLTGTLTESPVNGAGSTASYNNNGTVAYGVGLDLTGTGDPHQTDADNMAKNIAVGYEAYARRVYRLAAWSKLTGNAIPL